MAFWSGATPIPLPSSSPLLANVDGPSEHNCTSATVKGAHSIQSAQNFREKKIQ